MCGPITELDECGLPDAADRPARRLPGKSKTTEDGRDRGTVPIASLSGPTHLSGWNAFPEIHVDDDLPGK